VCYYCNPLLYGVSHTANEGLHYDLRHNRAHVLLTSGFESELDDVVLLVVCLVRLSGGLNLSGGARERFVVATPSNMALPLVVTGVSRGLSRSH